MKADLLNFEILDDSKEAILRASKKSLVDDNHLPCVSIQVLEY